MVGLGGATTISLESGISEAKAERQIPQVLSSLTISFYYYNIIIIFKGLSSSFFTQLSCLTVFSQVLYLTLPSPLPLKTNFAGFSVRILSLSLSHHHSIYICLLLYFYIFFFLSLAI